MRKVSESGFETGLGPAMRGQTGLETAPANRTVTRFTYALEQKLRVLSQTLIKEMFRGDISWEQNASYSTLRMKVSPVQSTDYQPLSLREVSPSVKSVVPIYS